MCTNTYTGCYCITQTRVKQLAKQRKQNSFITFAKYTSFTHKQETGLCIPPCVLRHEVYNAVMYRYNYLSKNINVFLITVGVFIVSKTYPYYKKTIYRGDEYACI